MKKILMFLLIGLCSLVCIFGLFDKKSNMSVYASYDNVYNYNATLSTDYSTTFLEGVKSVESVNFDYGTFIDITYKEPIDFSVSIDSGANFGLQFYAYPNAIIFNRGYNDTSLNRSKGMDMSVALIGDFTYFLNADMYYLSFSGKISRVILSDYYISFDFYNSFNNPVIYRDYSCNDSDLSYYVDLDSSTDYAYDLLSVIQYTYNNNIYKLYDFFTLRGGRHYTSSNLLAVSPNFEIWTRINGQPTDLCLYFNQNYYYCNVSFTFGDSSLVNSDNILTNDTYVNIKDFEMLINKPVHRLDNTLVLYNYDYDKAISSVTSIEYALSKDNDIYKAKYVGSLPNNKFIGIVSSDLQNRIYDNYIYMYLTFNQNTLKCNDGMFSLGFDFNFSRYYEPFVIRDTDLNTYNLPPLNKPDDWWDFGGWIRYGFVWLIFYNPIIAPISRFIVSIFGVFVNSITFLLGFDLGAFIMAFIGFIIVYNFFVSISPIQKIGKGINILDHELLNQINESWSEWNSDESIAKRQRRRKAIKRARHVKKLKKQDKRNENKQFKKEMKEFSRIHKEKHLKKK